MVKQSFPLILFLALLVVGGCSSSGTIVGTIYVIGNEPFTQVAVEDSAGTLFRISTSPELDKQLRGMQGRKVEVRFTKLTRSEMGRVITVESMKEVSQQRP